MSAIWRDPPAESEDYPGLVVHDGRVAGSITVGRSRLPMWAFVGWLPRGGWAEVESGWDEFHGWDAEKMGAFLYELMEVRGEFARLILMLADAERRNRYHYFGRPWWETKLHQKRIGDQLMRCLAALGSHDTQSGDRG